MIDLHAHILPGMDDGPRTLDESVRMCWMASRDGIDVMVATPHMLNGIYRNDRQTILRRVHELNQELTDWKVRAQTRAAEHPFPQDPPQRLQPIRICPGGDVAFSSDLVERLENGEIPTLNDGGRYLLLEFPAQGIPYRAEDVLFQLLARGVIPLISHPERNAGIASNLRRFHEMIRMGCLGQVTAMSLTGDFGDRIRRLSEKMLAHRLVHIIASDAHSIDHRPPILSRAVRAAARLVGEEEALKMVTEYPERILNGQRMSVPDPLPP